MKYLSREPFSCKPPTPAYEETWERLEAAGEFGKKEFKTLSAAITFCQGKDKTIFIESDGKIFI